METTGAEQRRGRGKVETKHGADQVGAASGRPAELRSADTATRAESPHLSAAASVAAAPATNYAAETMYQPGGSPLDGGLSPRAAGVQCSVVWPGGLQHDSEVRLRLPNAGGTGHTPAATPTPAVAADAGGEGSGRAQLAEQARGRRMEQAGGHKRMGRADSRRERGSPERRGHSGGDVHAGPNAGGTGHAPAAPTPPVAAGAGGLGSGREQLARRADSRRERKKTLRMGHGGGHVHARPSLGGLHRGGQTWRQPEHDVEAIRRRARVQAPAARRPPGATLVSSPDHVSTRAAIARAAIARAALGGLLRV